MQSKTQKLTFEVITYFQIIEICPGSSETYLLEVFELGGESLVNGD